MVILGGWLFLMSEVPLCYEHGRHACTPTEAVSEQNLQGNLAHKKQRFPETLQ